MIAHITITEIYLTLPILVAILAGYWFVISWQEYEKQNIINEDYVRKRESKEEGSSRKEQALMES